MLLFLLLLLLIASDADVDMHDVVLIIWLKFLCAHWARFDNVILDMADKQLLGFTRTEYHVAYRTRATDDDVRCIFEPTRTQNTPHSVNRTQLFYFITENFTYLFNIPFPYNRTDISRVCR